MATVTERLQLLITGSATDAIAAIRQTETAAAGLDAKTAATTSTMSKLSTAAGAVGAHIQQNIGMYSVVAVGALGAAAGASINEFTGLADKVREFSRASGASADTSSRLVAIFDDLEVSQSAADSGFFRLNRGIADGTANLQKYGAEVVRSKDGNLDVYKTLLSISDAYNSTEDSGERAALVQEAFGRGGKELIPILERGREGLKELYAAVPQGQILDEGQVESARQFELAVDDLSDAIMELKIAAGGELVPVLTGFISYSADAIRTANSARESVLGFAGGIAGPLKDAFTDSIPVIGPTVGLVKDLGSAFGIGGQESDKFADSQKRLSEAQQEVAKLAADSTTKHSDLAAAKRELRAAEEEYEGVARRVNDALSDQTSKILENQAAANTYINAQLGVTGAQLNVEAATKRYNESLFENGAEALETRQAAQSLEQQYVALGNATFDAAIKAGKSQKEAAAEQTAALSWVAGTLAPDSALRQFLNGYINDLNGVPRWIDTVLSIQSSADSLAQNVIGSASAWVLNRRASGGPVSAGTPYLVGEEGPELFVPGASGSIVPNGALASGGGSAAGGAGSTSMVFNIYDATDPERVMNAIARAVAGGSSVPPRVRAAFAG